MDCIDSYRNSLYELLEEYKWKKQVIVVRSDKWNIDGYRDKRNLYDDLQMHLNEKGYEVLDSCIAKYLFENLSLSKNRCNFVPK